MNLQEKRELYNQITEITEKQAISLRQSSDIYANGHGLDKEDTWNTFSEISLEIEKARKAFKEKIPEAIKLSNKKALEFAGVTAPTARKFEDWEREIITLTYVSNPGMSSRAVSGYLAELLPHRTDKSYQSFESRAGFTPRQTISKTKKAEQQKLYTKYVAGPISKSSESIVGTIVNCKVVKILPYGAILTTESGISGLLHLSQIRNSYIHNISDYLKVDQELKAKVITDPNGRLSFSTRDIPDNEFPQHEVSFKVLDAIPEGVPTEFKKKYVMQNLDTLKFDDLSTTLEVMIHDLESDKELIQTRINMLISIKNTVERESEMHIKMSNLKKYLTEV